MTDEPAADERLRALVRAEGDRLFAQFEALLWLRDMLELDWPLPPTRGWAASPDLLLEVVKSIRERPPETVVEMGSGTSSVVIAAALRQYGGGRLICLEHDDTYASRTEAELRRHALADRVSIVHAPLGDIRIGAAEWRWYTVPEWAIPERIDMLFVDGPPRATGPLARYPAVPFFADQLSDRVRIFLDDGDRPDEREVAARWAREDPTLAPSLIRSERDAWLLVRGA